MEFDFNSKKLLNIVFIFLVGACGKTEFTSKETRISADAKPNTENPITDSEEVLDQGNTNTDSNQNENQSAEETNQNETIDGSNQDDNDAVDSAYTSGVAWFWQCETNPISLPENIDVGTKVLEGQGPHQLVVDHDNKFKVQLSGFLCPPKTYSRDIVIVVDVSGSTFSQRTDVPYSSTGNPADLYENPGLETCEREKAVEALLGSLSKEENVRIGLLTFEDYVVANTRNLMSVAELKNYINNTNFLCDGAGGTNYAVALDSAGSMLDTGRVDALKEVYFMTDGEPNSPVYSARSAAVLKTKSKIITLMFGSLDDRHLRNVVASLDQNSQPLHTQVQNAQNLSTALGESAKAMPVEGLFKYRSLDVTTWNEQDLWQYTHNGVFKIPDLEFNPVEYPEGFEFSYTYKDNRGQEYGQSGTIIWDK